MKWNAEVKGWELCVVWKWKKINELWAVAGIELDLCTFELGYINESVSETNFG